MKYPNCPPKQVLFSGSNAKEEHAMYTFSTRKQDEHPRVSGPGYHNHSCR